MAPLARLQVAPSAGVTAPLVPAHVVRLLGPPPIAAGEDGERYERIFAHIAAALEPGDFIDWLRCRDIADLAWKIQRLARIERAIFATHTREALVDTLQALCLSDSRITPDLVNRWCVYEPEARREVDGILREHGTDSDAILAQAMVRHLPVFEALERMSSTARAQRDRIAADLKRARFDSAGTTILRSEEATDLEASELKYAERRR